MGTEHPTGFRTAHPDEDVQRTGRLFAPGGSGDHLETFAALHPASSTIGCPVRREI